MSWVVVDPTHRLRGSPLVNSVPERVEDNLWTPTSPDLRFVILKLLCYSDTELLNKGEVAVGVGVGDGSVVEIGRAHV